MPTGNCPGSGPRPAPRGDTAARESPGVGEGARYYTPFRRALQENPATGPAASSVGGRAGRSGEGGPVREALQVVHG